MQSYYVIFSNYCHGACLRDLARFDEAEGILTKAVEDWRASLGTERYELYMAISDLAMCIGSCQGMDEALPLHQEAVQGLTAVNGVGNYYTLSAMDALGCCLWDMGKKGEAKEVFEAAALGRIELLGPEHPDTLISVRNRDKM